MDNVTQINRPYPHPAQEVVMWTLPILMVSLNILVFIVAPRMDTIRPCTVYGMLSLAAADFSLGIMHIVRMIYNTLSHYKLQTRHPICTIDGYGLPLFASISIVTLAFMNLDRLFIMAFPLHYPTYLTRKKMISIQVAIWVSMIILFAPIIPGFFGTSIKYYPDAFMCVLNWAGSLQYSMTVFVLVQLIPTIIITISFVGIFYLARRRDKRIKGRSGNGGSRKKLKQDMRIFRTLAIMTFGFLLAWCPYSIMVTVPEMVTGHSLYPITDFITPWLGASNSFWNPLIYLPTMRPFYKATVELLIALPCVNRKERVNGRAVLSSGNSASSLDTMASNPTDECRSHPVDCSI